MPDMTDLELEELEARDPRAAQIDAIKIVFRCSRERAEEMWERANTVPGPPYVPSLSTEFRLPTETYDEVARREQHVAHTAQGYMGRPPAGKVAFDALMDVDPEFAKSIQGGMNDPTYASGRICEMLAAWRTHLTGR